MNSKQLSYEGKGVVGEKDVSSERQRSHSSSSTPDTNSISPKTIRPSWGVVKDKKVDELAVKTKANETTRLLSVIQ